MKWNESVQTQQWLLVVTERANVTWGTFLESPDNFSGPESYFMSATFTFKIQI